MMKYMPLVRRLTAPITKATSAEAPMATGHCRKPLSMPWKEKMPTA